MKTRFDITKNSTVVVEYDDVITGERRCREFMVPLRGGYVREWTGNDWRQVCDGLSTRGDTLYLNENGSLLSLIRREYRAMRRAEKAILG